ncbi:MAG: Uma2 family endonuclease, partial [Halothece sp. Uz-M2-17]|nr:Uma2 family endonuclease [Halothece sp. Uz-M2-17]
EYVKLQQYLNFDQEGDTRYELVNGELVPMAQPTGEHGAICEFLYDQFRDEIARLEQNGTAKLMMIAIQSPRGGRWETARIPDLMILDQSQWEAMRDRPQDAGKANRAAIIYLNEPPPLLVVEVVSPSTRNTDYRAKRVEYNVLNIPEYWVVDSQEQKVTVFQSIDQLYEGEEFVGGDNIISSLFPNLNCSVQQIFNPSK